MERIEYQKRKQAEIILRELTSMLEPKKNKSSVAYRLHNQLVGMTMSVYTMPMVQVDAVIANKEKNINVANAC